MNNKFYNNNKDENRYNEDVIEVIDVEEVEILEENRDYRKEYDDYYRKVIDEALENRDKKNKKRNKMLVSVATCALLVSFSGGFLANNYLNSRDLNKTQNIGYSTNNTDKNKSNQDNTNKSEADKAEDNKSEVNKSETNKVEESNQKENLSTEQIAKLVSPAVVTVTATSGGNMFSQSKEGVGTGFIIDKDGKVVTNYHVIEGASEVRLTLQDGREVRAKIIRTSKKDDLALLQIIDDIEMPGVANLAKDDNINAGQDVVAIGNPLGKELSGTVTKGIISATKRIVNMDGFDKEFMQIDAAINPGNSGGPLINSKGEVIGVNTAKRGGENVEGIGFSVPIKYVRQLIENPENYTNENDSSQNDFSNGYYEGYQGNQDQWGTSPYQGGELPEQWGTFPYQGGELPEQWGTFPYQGGELPEQWGTSPEQWGTSPYQGGALPEQWGAFPEQYQGQY